MTTGNMISDICINDYVEIDFKRDELFNESIIDITGTLDFDERVREWCKLPYANHPKGCPNWNKSEKCPPKIKKVDEYFDLEAPHWFAIVTFNLASHRKKMALRHPKWSDKQCNCCLYWQNSVRRRQKTICSRFIDRKFGYTFTLLPEAMGVNVFKTAQKYGIYLKKNPKDIVFKIALIGKLKNIKKDDKIVSIQQTDFFCELN